MNIWHLFSSTTIAFITLAVLLVAVPNVAQADRGFHGDWGRHDGDRWQMRDWDGYQSYRWDSDPYYRNYSYGDGYYMDSYPYDPNYGYYDEYDFGGYSPYDGGGFGIDFDW